MRSIVITRLFTFFYPLRLAFKSLSIHQLNDISTAGVPFPDKAPKRRLKIKKIYVCNECYGWSFGIPGFAQ